VGLLGLRERPGSGIQNRISEHGPCARASGRCGGQGENRSGYLDDASIKASTVQVTQSATRAGSLNNANFEKTKGDAPVNADPPAIQAGG